MARASFQKLQRVAQGEVSGIYEQMRWAFTEIAVDVENEDPGTTNHTARIKWAQKWRAVNIDTPMESYLSFLLENATLSDTAAIGGTDAEPTVTWVDSDVEFQASAVLNRVAALP